MPSNRAHLYDSNDIHFDSIPTLEGEIRHLPVICLYIFYLATPSSLDTYHMSFERSFRGDPNAVETVGIGSGEAEIFELQVGSVELVGHSKGK